MGRIEKGLQALLSGRPAPPDAKNEVTVSSGVIAGSAAAAYMTADERSAMRLSAVNRCVEVLSDSIGKLPIAVKDGKTRKTVPDHPLMQLLQMRPNHVQTSFMFSKMMEANRLCGGNGCAYIRRDPRSGAPVQLIPIPRSYISIKLDKKTGMVRYAFRDPFTDRAYENVDPMDMLHVMGYTYNGYSGVSVLERAAEVIGTGRASQDYALAYYANGGQPAGVLQTDTDITGTVDVTVDGQTVKKSKKDIIRDEWAKLYSGPTNAGKVAVLDLGLKYSPISINNRDAQFIEQTELSIQDIARFFGVPLYKLQSGKQSYSSNEQNAVEYVVGTLHPIVQQYEQEYTYKLLTPKEIEAGLTIQIDMLAELKGDTASRATWYRTLREISVLSPNDIREIEEWPDIEGGDEYEASLNYVPLSDWKELSRLRAEGRGGIAQ